MHEEPTTAVIERYLDALPGDPAAELIIRGLLDRAVGRLRLLCATHLHRSYRRLAQPPVNLETDELLGGVVARLLTALRTTRPPTVRQFFALANQHMRWQLNDLARLLHKHPRAAALAESGVAAPPGSSRGPPDGEGRRSASCSASRARARFRRLCTVLSETPTTAAASACVSPWMRTRSKTSRSSSGSSSIARSMRRPSGVSPETLLAGAGMSPSWSSTADGPVQQGPD